MTLLRSLLEDEEDFVYDDNGAGEDGGTFDARVFWGVNCFIAFLLCGVCIWCFYFGRKYENLSNRRAATDRQFQETVRNRHEQRMAARRSTPTKRLARLKRSFVRNKVQMVVKEGDIVQGDEMSPNCGDINVTLHNSSNDETLTEQQSFLSASTIEHSEHGAGVAEQTEDSGVISGPHPATTSGAPAGNPKSPPLESESAAVAMEEGIPAQEEPAGTSAIEHPTVDENDAAIDTAVLSSDMMSTSSISEHPTGYLVLRPGDTPKPPPGDPQMVPNCCAVCLGAYEPGDTVVWSCNPECAHAFHLECIMEWFLKIHDGGTPCPCCRQEFTSWETDRQERKIKWAAGHTFDVRAVSL